MISSERQAYAVMQQSMNTPCMLTPKPEELDHGSTNGLAAANTIRWRMYETESLDPVPQPPQQQQVQEQPSRPSRPQKRPETAHTVVKKPNEQTTGIRRDYVAWSKRETEGLVRWLDSQDNFSAMKRNTAQMLPQLAEHLRAQISGCTKTAKQCDHKIRNLKKCYKKVKEKFGRAGQSEGFESASLETQEEILDQFPYFKEFERITRDEHVVKAIPNELLRLAADGGQSRSQGKIGDKHESLEIFQDDRLHSRNNSTAPHTPVTSKEIEFPDMSRFRSIRSKEDQQQQSQQQQNQQQKCVTTYAKSFPTPETLSPPNSVPATTATPVGHKNMTFLNPHIPPHHPPPALSPDSQPDFKRQRLSSNYNFISPFQMLNAGCSPNNNNMFAVPEMEIMGKCPVQLDPLDTLSKCPVNMDGSGPASLFGPTGLASFSQILDTPTSNESSETGMGENDANHNNNTHANLLNILKVMSHNKKASNMGHDAIKEEPNDDTSPSTDDSYPQETALILAEHIKSALAKKEATSRQKLYLNHLQSQIQRHTMRVEMLYNNGQVSRAEQVMDKIDELEQELHDALSRPLDQF